MAILLNPPYTAHIFNMVSYLRAAILFIYLFFVIYYIKKVQESNMQTSCNLCLPNDVHAHAQQ